MRDESRSDGLAPWKIVLAEDDEDHAFLIRRALERASKRPVDVEWARNGDAALEAMEREAPDLLLLDLKMPGASGHEVLERVKEDETLRGVPVVVLTSSDRDEDVARSYGLGANHYLTKPESPTELENRLRGILEHVRDLHGARRGAGEVPANAVSDLRPPVFSLSSEIVWGILFALAAAAAIFFLVGR